jgi:hypothetical protein
MDFTAGCPQFRPTVDQQRLARGRVQQSDAGSGTIGHDRFSFCPDRYRRQADYPEKIGFQGRGGLTDDRSLLVRKAEPGCMVGDVRTRTQVASDYDLGATVISVGRGGKRRTVEDVPEV